MWHPPGDPATDEDSLPSWEELTVLLDRGLADIREEVNHQLGIGARRVRYQPPDGPDVSALREAMGL